LEPPLVVALYNGDTLAPDINDWVNGADALAAELDTTAPMTTAATPAATAAPITSPTIKKVLVAAELSDATRAGGLVGALVKLASVEAATVVSAAVVSAAVVSTAVVSTAVVSTAGVVASLLVGLVVLVALVTVPQTLLHTLLYLRQRLALLAMHLANCPG